MEATSRSGRLRGRTSACRSWVGERRDRRAQRPEHARGGRYAEADSELLSTLAANVGVAIQNARLFAEVERQQQYFESLVEISPVAVIVMDADERVTGWNPAAAELFGYSAEEAIGRSIDDLVLGDAGATRGGTSRARRRRQGRAQRITRRARKDGTPVDVELMLAPLTVDGEHVGFYAIYHDITELQRARERAETLLDGDAGARQDTEPRGHDRGDPRRAATRRALRQLLGPGDPGQPPGDRRRARLRRSGGAPRSRASTSTTRPTSTARSCGRSGHRSSPTSRRTRHFASEFRGSGRIRGWICAPMIVGDRVVGVISVDKFEPGLLQRGAGRARDGVRRPGGDRDRERPPARDRARCPRAGRDAPRRGALAREHARACREVFDLILAELRKVVPVPGRERPAVRRQRAGDRRRLRLSGPRRAARASATTGADPTIPPASWSSGTRRSSSRTSPRGSRISRIPSARG